MSYLEKRVNKMENYGTILLIIIPFISLMAGKYFLSNNPVIAFLIGLFLGVLTSVVVTWRDKYIREENNYKKGLFGEKYVYRLLKSFKSYIDFEFIEDVKFKFGNADFIIISENGVFCIEVKNIKGKITYDKINHRLMRNLFDMDKDYLKQVRSSSKQVQQIISDKVNYVQPVLVFLDFGVNIETNGNLAGVHILKTENLFEFLKQKTNNNLDTETQSKIYEKLLKYKLENE